MPIIKQNTFIDPESSGNINNQQYVPAIDNNQSDSDILIASATGLGVINVVSERYWDASKPGFRTRQVNSYEVLDAYTKPIMEDSDYFLQNHHTLTGTEYTPSNLQKRTGSPEGYQITSTGIGNHVNGGSINAATYPSGKGVNPQKIILHANGNNDLIVEGVVYYAFNNNAICVTPTSNFEIWDLMDAQLPANLRVRFNDNVPLGTPRNDRTLADARSPGNSSTDSTLDAYNLDLK